MDQLALTPQALLLAGFILFNLFLIAVVRWHPPLTTRMVGRVVAFFALFLLPLLVFSFSAVHHLDKATTTTFCLSCHVMEPYGESLTLDGSNYVPASHVQNHRVPADRACYTCHTTYTMFGDVQAKLTGVKHVYVNYLGTVPDRLTLYEPYQNRECLHCHGGARAFEANDFHASRRDDLDLNTISCLDCHSRTHAIDQLDTLPHWTGVSRATGGNE